MVLRYLDWQFAANLPATWGDFHRHSPSISHYTFKSYSGWWRDNQVENPTVMKWYDEIRLGRFNGKILARYLEWQCAASAPANWADFHSRYLMGKYNDFIKYCYKWRDAHLKDSEALQWFNEVRRAPSRRRRVIKWLDEQYSAGKSGWYWLFIQQNEDYSYQEFNGGRGAWENGHKGDKNALTWGKQYKFGSTRAHLIGNLFEQSLISDLHNDLKKRGISLYYNTTSIAALGRSKGRFDKHLRRVEGRLFASDLLAPNSNIGPDLREFLMKSGRPQLALDVTLGDNVGGKIILYADDVTGLLVITPRGNDGQRHLEVHVRVLNIAELAGPRWLNCDPATRAELDRIVEETFEALKGGPDSAAWQRLQSGATQKWQVVTDDLKARGSQAEYRARVADEVASHLRQGKMPQELAAYIKTARAAGHVEHAGRVEGLAHAITALVRHSNEQKGPARELITKEGGNTHEHKDLLQMVEDDMHYLEGLDREDAKRIDGNIREHQDLLQMVEDDIHYLESLDREDAEQNEGAPEADADGAVDREYDQSNPPDTMEASDAMLGESPEDEDEEDAEDDHEDFV